MTANRRLPVVVRTQVSRKTDSDPSALLVSIETGLLILAFGAAWFVFLRGLTALGRMLMVWHFHI
jgi:hypothetical protein